MRAQLDMILHYEDDDAEGCEDDNHLDGDGDGDGDGDSGDGDSGDGDSGDGEREKGRLRSVHASQN